MNSFYVANLSGESGICKYAHDFYQWVLKPKGFHWISIDESIPEIMSKISSRDYVHLEIGIFQKKELQLLFTMLNANYRNVSVTLHDAPLVSYPFHQFQDDRLNLLSKIYDRYINRFQSAIPMVRKIKSIYVLSQRGLESIRMRYKIENVYYLPHVVDLTELETPPIENNNLIYFGFIGRNKGIEHALKMHQALLTQYPDLQFYVAGTALGKEMQFLQYLKKTYQKNVHYLGYVKEKDLQDVFSRSTFAIILFKDYQFYFPFSGSLLQALKKGKIVLTNPVNAIPELIRDRETGIFLSGDLQTDIRELKSLFHNPTLLKEIQQQAHHYLTEKHNPDMVAQHFRPDSLFPNAPSAS